VSSNWLPGAKAAVAPAIGPCKLLPPQFRYGTMMATQFGTAGQASSGTAQTFSDYFPDGVQP